jgi:hypothetical protein
LTTKQGENGDELGDDEVTAVYSTASYVGCDVSHIEMDEDSTRLEITPARSGTAKSQGGFGEVRNYENEYCSCPEARTDHARGRREKNHKR